jgi:hypothetical protein
VLHLEAPTFVDATELGELLPATGTEYVTGAESRAQTGEPHAKDVPLPGNHQAFTCCFAVDHLAGEDHTLDRPAEYAFWRDYVPALTPPWPGRLLSLTYSHPRTLQPHSLGFDPERGTGLFRYRRILDRTLFNPGAVRGDLTLVNWPQNDYLLGTLIDVSPAEANRHIARAKQLSLSLLYWLQTEAPRPDGGTGWKGLRLRPDVVGTTDGLAKAPYVRESRRIRALCTVTENHVSREVRERIAGPGRPARAERFDDSVGIGSYAIDLHPTCGGFNYIDFETLPVSDPARRAPARACGKPARRREKPRHDAPDQRLLPPPPRRVVDRRGRGGAGLVFPPPRPAPARRARTARRAGRVPGRAAGRRRAPRMAGTGVSARRGDDRGTPVPVTILQTPRKPPPVT